MIRVTCSLSRKIPDPQQDFATRLFAAEMSAEVCEGTPEAAIKRIHALWDDLQRAVDQRVAALQPSAGHANGNGHYQHRESQPVKGNGNGRPIQRQESNGLSGKQKNYLLGLSSKRGWRIPRLNEELVQIVGRSDASLHGLSRHEASLAIETLKGEQ